MNEYQKKLVQGIYKFLSEIDKMNPEEIANRIERSKYKDSFRHYSLLEKMLCGNISWRETGVNLMSEDEGMSQERSNK